MTYYDVIVTSLTGALPNDTVLTAVLTALMRNPYQNISQSDTYSDVIGVTLYYNETELRVSNATQYIVITMSNVRPPPSGRGDVTLIDESSDIINHRIIKIIKSHSMNRIIFLNDVFDDIFIKTCSSHNRVRLYVLERHRLVS